MINDVLLNAGRLFGDVQAWLFEQLVQPAMFHLGLGNLLEDGYSATGWLLVGLMQLAVIVLVFGSLQRWRPVEPVTDRAAVRVDILYTLIHRLGLVRLVLFFSVDPLWDLLFGRLTVAGWTGWHLDQALAPLWAGVTDTAWFAFLAYLVVFDLLDYALHRGQHRFAWWWALHAVHHSQRQMTMWSDNRNHLLDDLIRDVAFVLLARLIGVPPGQFVALVACSQLVESLSHANLRLAFGPFERVLVSPRFHRRHHAVESGGPEQGARGENFAVLFPVWDILFRTANFAPGYPATGIRDQAAESGARDYGRGFWSQQWLALRRIVGAA